MSWEAIALELGISKQGCQQLASRALVKVRKNLQRLGIDLHSAAVEEPVIYYGSQESGFADRFSDCEADTMDTRPTLWTDFRLPGSPD